MPRSVPIVITGYIGGKRSPATRAATTSPNSSASGTFPWQLQKGSFLWISFFLFHFFYMFFGFIFYPISNLLNELGFEELARPHIEGFCPTSCVPQVGDLKSAQLSALSAK